MGSSAKCAAPFLKRGDILPKALDLTNQRYGRLVVTGFDKINKNSSGKSIRYWNCQCDCGNTVSVSTQNLRNGNTLSCGCYKREKVSHANYKHGQRKTRLYNIWNSMKKRCYNSNHQNYKNYGGRGIKVCNEWLGEHGFENFYNWSMNTNYANNLTIDRINVNGDYTPDNCRWATWKEQQNNRRNNRRFYYNGKNLLAREWSELTGINLRTLLNRLYIQNWSIERALTEPIHNRNTN